MVSVQLSALHLALLVISFSVTLVLVGSVPIPPTTTTDPVVPIDSMATNPFLQDAYTRPVSAVSATASDASASDELRSWLPLAVFRHIASEHPEIDYLFSDENTDTDFVVFAPTNQAFLHLFLRIARLVDLDVAGPHDVQTVLSDIQTVFQRYPDAAKAIVQTHIVYGDWTEFDVLEQGELQSMSGASLDVSQFPKISVTATNTSANRMYRPIVTSRHVTARIAFVDDALLPRSLDELLFHGQGSGATDHEQPQPLPGSPHSHDAWIERVLSSLGGLEHPSLGHAMNSLIGQQAPRYFADGSRVFDSPMTLLAARTDCTIFEALLKAMPHSDPSLQSAEDPVHVFAPTDRAFLGMMSKMSPFAPPNHLLHDGRNENAIKNLALVIALMWPKNGNPSLRNVVMHHFALGAAMPIQQLAESTLQSLAGGEILVSEDGWSIEDRRFPTGSVPVLASHATSRGIVTIIDGMLTKFDEKVAQAIGEIFDSILSGASLPESLLHHGIEPEQTPVFDSDGHHGPRPDHSTDPDDEDRERSSGACFPGDAALTAGPNRTVAMRDLHGGDEIMVSGSGRYSRVMAFTHRDPSRLHPFLQITFSDGTALTLSDEHYTYVDGRLKAASVVRAGDRMRGDGGRGLVVTGVRRVWKTGKYAPHTVHGDLVVDGVVVSAYTTFVHPTVAHALLMPVRLVTVVSGMPEPLGSILYRGGDWVGRYIPKGAPAY